MPAALHVSACDIEADAIVEQIGDEAWRGAPDNGPLKLSTSKRWAALKRDPEETQIAVMLAAARAPMKDNTARSYRLVPLHKHMVAQILRRDLPFTEAHLVPLLAAWSKQDNWSRRDKAMLGLDWGLPGKRILGALERYAGKPPLSDDCVRVLTRLRDDAANSGWGLGPNKPERDLAARIDRLLHPPPALPAGEEPSLPDLGPEHDGGS